MKVICCYCKKDLGDKAPFEDKSVSHGACKSCAEKDLKRQLAIFDNKSESLVRDNFSPVNSAP